MMAVSARIKGPVTLPATLVLAIAAYHGAALLIGWTLADQRQAGWLLSLPPRLTLVLPWSAEQLHMVDWPVLARHAVGLLALIPVTTICLLLGISGIEAASGHEASVDRDLRANGIAALACGGLGGVLGITSASRTILVYGMGVRSWHAGVLAGILAGVPLLWPGLLGVVPRFVLGGLLLFVGFGMLRQWVLQSRRRLTVSEYLTVLVVLAIAARFGLIMGAFAGLLLGCIAFAVICSRSSPIRARYRGDVARSQVDRSEPEEDRLAAQSDTLLVLHLQGFVFFGTANRVVDELRTEMNTAARRLRDVILEFANVQGVDGSALASFERLQRLAASERIVLTFANMPAQVASRLAELPPVPGAVVHVTPTLDAALRRREAAILAEAAPTDTAPLAAMLIDEFEHRTEAMAFLGLLKPTDFATGDLMMRQGELSDDLLFIERGQASVYVTFKAGAAPRQVRTLAVGTMVGEIGFCLGLPRTATITADGPCRALRLTRAAMERLEAEHPAVALAFQRVVLRRLGKRLLNKDQLIAALVLERAN